MKRLSLLTLAFAVLSLVFLVLLVFFRQPFPLYPLLSVQDCIDLLTPVVLIPTYWLLFRHAARVEANRRGELAFMAFAAVWVLGHGMHLSANSVNNVAEALARKQGVDFTGTSVYELAYFYDEHLSHYLWHIGLLGLAGLLIYQEWRGPVGIDPMWWVTVLAGLIYGFTYFCIFLEGGTMLLGLPFSIIITLLTLVWGRKQLARRPILAFFFVACLVALVLYAGWGLYWGGFPQFTEVGLL